MAMYYTKDKPKRDSISRFRRLHIAIERAQGCRSDARFAPTAPGHQLGLTAGFRLLRSRNEHSVLGLPL